MQASGIGGRLLAGWYPAAKLGPWSLAPADETGDRWVIQTVLSSHDEFWITQRPLRVELALGDLGWSWDVVEFDGSSTIHVSGPPREGLVVIKENHE